MNYSGTVHLATNLAQQLWLRIGMLAQRPDERGRTAPMRRWLRARLDRPTGREDLARHFDLAPAYVSYLFTKECGCGPVAGLRRTSRAMAPPVTSTARASSQPRPALPPASTG